VREIRIVDVVDAASFGRIPPCADPAFDHRTCDHWENPNGSRSARPSWLQPPTSAPASQAARPRANPFAVDENDALFGAAALPADWVSPSAPPARQANPFAREPDDDPFDGNPFAPPGADAPNPFAPGGGAAGGGFGAAPGRGGSGPAGTPGRGGPPALDPSVPRKLALLSRGLRVFGTYARVLLVDDRPAAYAQFGPISAYPRAQRLRELYPRLPDSPLPAVITCIATTPEARGEGLALRLVSDVCDDLAGRGFAAVESYPEAGAAPDRTSSASPAFWVRAGFAVVVDDAHFPVVRREL
jgi:GNAT superfamily N-acetyltransferase